MLSDGSDGARETRPALPGNNAIPGSILPLPSSTLADVQHASARRRLEGRAQYRKIAKCMQCSRDLRRASTRR